MDVLGLDVDQLWNVLLSWYTSKHSIAFLMAFWASMGTFLGGILVVLVIYGFGADPTSPSTTRLMGILQAFSAGVMLFITCFHLVPESTEAIGSQQTMGFFFIGILLFGILEKYVIPHEHDHEEKPKKKSKVHKDAKQLMRTSLITFVAMALHNLPEGLGVYLSSLSNPKMGMQLAVAIMLHNIPEGMAVAIPLYAATASYSKVLWWTFVNGLAEPLGVVLGGAVLYPYLNAAVLSKSLALVGGIMVCISMHELQPTAIQYAGKGSASFYFFVGMGICWVALEAVESYFGHAHHHDRILD